VTFRPAFLLGGPHRQTLWPKLFRRHPIVPVTPERVPTPDGDVLEVDFLPHRPGAPGVVVLHGLESRARTRHVRSLLARVDELGWNGAALNFRWAGKAPHSKPATWKSGDPHDVAHLLRVLRERWPGSRLGAAGFSLGGSVILRYLGEEGGAATLDCAVTISAAYDFAACAGAIDAPGFWPSFYRKRLLKSLKRKALATAERFPGTLDARAVEGVRSIREFDERVTAPLNGAASAEEYWARTSAGPVLGAIRVPVLLVNAEDDPFVPASSIPRATIAANPALTLMTTPTGGHMAFIAGTPWKPVYVAERAAIAFLTEKLGAAESSRARAAAV